MKKAAAAAVILAGLLMLKGLVGALEPKLTFFPYRGEDRTPASLGINYEVVRLTTADGETIVAWQLEPQTAIADVIYFHGNGGNLSVWLPILASLHAQNLRVLAVDYRGYGLSTGRPSEEGVYLDAQAVVRYATQRRGQTPQRPLVFWGRSLGGPIAASATRVARPDGLILESSFVDKAAVIRSNAVLRMLNVFGAYRFATASMLEKYRNPILVLHGRADSIVPFALGRELYERLADPKQFVAIDGTDHNDLVEISRADYWGPVLQFIRTLRRTE
jgi:fermentation-respiration switch protein FrsA (DUF1100 family)